MLSLFPLTLGLPIFYMLGYCSSYAAKSLQSCPTVRPHRWQPTRLCYPWDSSGKNTGVGCHFLLSFCALLPNVTSSEMPSLNHSTLGGHSSYHYQPLCSSPLYQLSYVAIFFVYLFTTCLHQETVSSKEAEGHLSYLKLYTVSFTVPHNPRCAVKTD